ncbi:MAG: hypothetical protein ABI837_19520 [Acidobacteriota bacterium]
MMLSIDVAAENATWAQNGTGRRRWGRRCGGERRTYHLGMMVVAPGIIVMTIIDVMDAGSGAHLNPAVTLGGKALSRRIGAELQADGPPDGHDSSTTALMRRYMQARRGSAQ